MGSLCPGVSLSRESLTGGVSTPGDLCLEVSVQGGSLSRGVSVQGEYLVQGSLCPGRSGGVSVWVLLSGGSLSKGGLCPRGVSCPGESLSRQVWGGGCLCLGVAFWGVSVQGSILSRGVSVQAGLGGVSVWVLLSRGSLSRGVSVQAGLWEVSVWGYGKEQAVRILLECILVCQKFHAVIAFEFAFAVEFLCCTCRTIGTV